MSLKSLLVCGAVICAVASLALGSGSGSSGSGSTQTPPPAPSCKPQCPKEVCDKPLCGWKAPYRCTDASGSTACYRSPPMSGECVQCCDTRSCGTEMPCTKPCSDAVCSRIHCSGNATFECTSGPSRGGCSTNPDGWTNSTFCGGCCDASKCGSEPPAPTGTPAPTTFTCKDKCDKATCTFPYRCGMQDPFMCTSGKAKDGCSNSSSYWPESSLCTGCCDVKSCRFRCTECSAALCAQQNCGDTARYQCTSGPDAGACSNSSSYWGDQPGCSACCLCPPS